MKTFILFLIIAIFLQTTLIPVNLSLIMIVSRGLVVEDKANLYISLFAGIILGLLSSLNIGSYALLYLIYSILLMFFKRSAVSSNFFLFLPIAFLIYLTTNFLEKLIFNQSFNFYKILIELTLTIPFYLLIKFWEERFSVRQGIKLKIRG